MGLAHGRLRAGGAGGEFGEQLREWIERVGRDDHGTDPGDDGIDARDDADSGHHR
jgi:hypothetical protein